MTTQSHYGTEKTFVLERVENQVITAIKYAPGIKFSQYIPQFDFPKQDQANGLSVAHCIIYLPEVSTEPVLVFEGDWVELSSSGTGLKVWKENELFYKYRPYVPEAK